MNDLRKFTSGEELRSAIESFIRSCSEGRFRTGSGFRAPAEVRTNAHGKRSSGPVSDPGKPTNPVTQETACIVKSSAVPVWTKAPLSGKYPHGGSHSETDDRTALFANSTFRERKICFYFPSSYAIFPVQWVPAFGISLSINLRAVFFRAVPGITEGNGLIRKRIRNIILIALRNRTSQSRDMMARRPAMPQGRGDADGRTAPGLTVHKKRLCSGQGMRDKRDGFVQKEESKPGHRLCR